MTYNPALQKWEGNEEALRVFSPPQVMTTRPALISAIRAPKTRRVVGSMTFDPIRMCWIGNEDDMKAFEGIECTDESSIDSNPNRKGEFNIESLNSEFIQSEKEHKKWMGKWYLRALSDHKVIERVSLDRQHLYEIRNLIKTRIR